MKNTFRTTRILTVLAIGLFVWTSCSKQQPAGADIPIKDCVELKAISLPFNEPSGIAFSEALQKMWVVGGGNQRIYQLDTNGIEEKRLAFREEGVDLEGIAFDESDSSLWVLDEAAKKIFHLDLDGNVLFQKLLSYASEPNNGPEGITVGSNQTLFVLNEKNPSVLFELDSNYEIAFTHQLNFASDYSDLSFNRSSNTFFILSDESKAFYRVNEKIEVMEQYNLPVVKNEGIAYDERRDIFYIVNDAAHTLSWYKVK